MANGKASAARPDVASRSVFDALAIDDGNDYSSEEEQPTPAATLLSPPTPSKKAAARKRAQLRKKGSKNTLSASEGTESDSPVGHSIPPVPTLPSPPPAVTNAAAKINGLAKEAVKEAPEVVEQVKEAVVEAVAPVFEAAKAHTATAQEPLIADDASSSDAETQAHYTDDDDASDIDETSPPSPLPKSPSPPSPPATVVSSPLKEAYTGADHDPNKKIKAIITRTVWGLVMGGGAIGIVALGHIYVIILVFVCQAVVFSELTSLFDVGYSGGNAVGEGETAVSQRDRERELRRRGRREERDRWSRRMSWYFFAATNYFLYGESLVYWFKHILTLQASFLPTAFSFAQYHRLISFGLYIIGFVSFVANLKRSQLRRQFGLFGWIHMSLLLIVVSSHFIVNNILEGMIWFWVPASLVIFNDIAAYVCGMLFGRHQLIKLSPKKTVEGFVGAFFLTILIAVAWSTFFMRFNYMICPVQDLSSNAFSEISCTPNPVFNWREFALPESAIATLKTFTGHTFSSIPWAPFQLHSIVLAIFASLVAPFGGFFASGFKRAFGIKDFGDSIPGHGGMTDRMDCQFLTGLFTFVYYASLIRGTHITVSSVLATAISGLTTEQQAELVKELGKVLAAKGVQAIGM